MTARFLTFAAIRRNLSEGVVTAVALASDHAGLTRTLAAVQITCSGEGADRVAVTQQAGVAAFGTVVVVLETGLERRRVHLHHTVSPPEDSDKLQLLIRQHLAAGGRVSK